MYVYIYIHLFVCECVCVRRMHRRSATQGMIGEQAAGAVMGADTAPVLAFLFPLFSLVIRQEEGGGAHGSVRRVHTHRTDPSDKPCKESRRVVSRLGVLHSTERV